MKKVNVQIINREQLRLLEDANTGDIIDLNDIKSVDTTIIIEKINQAADKIYQEKVNEALEKQRLIIENKTKDQLNELIKEKELLESDLERVKADTTKDLENKHQLEIIELKHQISQISNEKANSEQKIINRFNETINQYNNQIKDLESKLNSFNDKSEVEKLKLTNEHKDVIAELKSEIDRLSRSRSSLTVKDIGESLEDWCDNEFNRNNLVLPPNIVWQKDNEVVKGSKADFIYKVYATEARDEDELLTSAILEMKSEDPLAKNKPNRDRFYRELDKDRNNKNIEYAILVSEIDMKDSNDVPIRKISDYDKMFEVRPQYFMTLLNIITAFGLKYKEILLADKEERIKFKDIEDILNEFEIMKNEILDNSVRHINTQVSEIIKQANYITDANDKIIKAANVVLNTHLQTVKNKIEGFQINKIRKGIEKINE